ncbi:hypothetical protein G1H11_02065 [Phytoactinopolyspora alkaliphila]|uniref:Uncharacterized protein n=1 Tax=Phytoactinopolyspora alkaliphila TaxID=1783498 RepID=A0A6N9YGT0_9ACTN|nr:hypothetical protein [Phytoactinopolyspora alkaliphila]NED94089.1 hypothetical protein [Phytoactinopolyspora alkaliphila]
MTDASLAPAVLESTGKTPPVPWPVIEACGLPEIGARLSGFSVRIDPQLSRPFAVAPGNVTIRPDRAATVTGAALILREAIELGEKGITEAAWADRILAHATAVVFGATGLAGRAESAACAAFSPLSADAAEIIALHDRIGSAGSAATARSAGSAATARDLAERIARFLRERDESADECPPGEIERAARALPFSPPAEVLIASGGDSRQSVDWFSGCNSYGVSPSPTPWTALFGSCTASSPTVRAFDAAAGLRRRLIDAALADDIEAMVSTYTAAMRTTLLTALGVTAPVEVVFTPSGTDAELVPLLIALSEGEPVHSVVVGQHEIGSGGVYAAAGRHFCDRLPSGEAGQAGAPVGGLDSSAVVTSVVDVRGDDGQMLRPQHLEELIEEAIDAYPGYRSLVHVVEGSKTGIRLPRHETVRAWRQRYGDRLDVVVDAAQMRVDQHTAAAHVRDGHIVIVTGSKFFGGPPFSGAVIIPAHLAARLASGRQLPAGVAGYLRRSDVPASLPDLHAVAKPGMNAGLLLRWEAALAEMRSFHNASPEIRDEVLRVLASGLRRIVEETPWVSLVESPYTAIPDPDRRGLDDLPTIFTFLAIGADGRPITMEQAKVVHRLLSQDLRDIVPVNEPVLRRTFQLGQPVRILRRGDAWLAGLRLAVGAPTVSEIVFDHTRGRVWTERLERTLADSADALRKLGLILEHLDLEQTADTDGGSPRCLA